MNDFDHRWQECAGRARQIHPRDETAPYGFATRAAARGMEALNAKPDGAWEGLSLRLLTGAVVVLVVCAVLEMPHLRDSNPLEPGVENTVAQLVWSL